MKKKEITQRREYSWGFYISTLITLGILAMIFAGIMSLFTGNGISTSTGNVALIPIKGIIMGDSAKGIITTAVAGSSDIVKMIEKANKDNAIKAIIFEIDSPGGMVVPTDEIGQAIKRSNKTTVAWIRSAGASGAYWIATTTNITFANKMSAVGSIGVISSYLQFSGLMERYNVTYERLIAGKYKDMGSPYKDLTIEEREIIQEIIDQMREYFIKEVAENRNLDYNKTAELATGQIYLGIEAKELGLIDELGGKEEIKEYLKKQLNLTEIKLAEYKKTKTLFQRLGSASSENYYYVGKGIGASFIEQSELPSYPMIWS